MQLLSLLVQLAQFSRHREKVGQFRILLLYREYSTFCLHQLIEITNVSEIHATFSTVSGLSEVAEYQLIFVVASHHFSKMATWRPCTGSCFLGANYASPTEFFHRLGLLMTITVRISCRKPPFSKPWTKTRSIVLGKANKVDCDFSVRFESPRGHRL